MIFAAPLQGYTTAPWRHWHAEIFGHSLDGPFPVAYLSPFLRIDKGKIKQRELRDIATPLNRNHRLIPQIIFSDSDEFDRLSEAVCNAGYDCVNLNLGCPYPMQTGRGRGAALTAAPRRLEAIVTNAIKWKSELRFSVKMRLGMTDHSDWRQTIQLITGFDPEWVAIHPRIARQLYKGELHTDEMAGIVEAIGAPAIFNGDLITVDDIKRIEESTHPHYAGAMIGRGLLARPWLTAEYAALPQSDPARHIELTRMFHDRIADHYATTLCGDHQILATLKSFWDYSGSLFDHRSLKRLRKASRLSDYFAAVADLISTEDR